MRLKRNENTFYVIIVLLVAVLVFFAGVFTKCHGQADSTMVSNEKIISLAAEVSELRLMDSIYKQMNIETDKLILNYQIQRNQDSLTIYYLQSIANKNVSSIVVAKQAWYEKKPVVFAFGFLTSAVIIYTTKKVFRI